ncbi:MAG TPA: hypothetical protein VLF18_01605 [Tahibacter sp.]|uniref:WD40/YVTN/BNR-like repeat-containing protein n=1 Tax=Tahibacter sp. TaxID=2056211 RepID=UPI002CD1A0A8|nr:hypothetical protein [Tahibacter sp.]HSX58870.1 hypothetical protein [Tahibacter sp.]
MLAVVLCSVGGAAHSQSWVPLGNDGGFVDYLLVDPATPGRLYATAAGIAVSDDAGRHWRPANAGLHATTGSYIAGLVADADVPGRLYAIDRAGLVMRSDDAASNWVPTGYSLNLPLAAFGSSRLPMADVPGSATTLLITDGRSTIYKSTDSGATFSPLAYLSYTYQSIVTMAVDPANPQHILVGLGLSSQSMSNPTLIRSTDGGATFHGVQGGPSVGTGSSIVFVPGGPVLAVLNGRVHVSGDGGASWQSSGVVATRVAVSSQPPYEAVAMNATSCRRSADFLAGSTDCSDGLPSSATYARFTDLAVVSDGPEAFRAISTTSVTGARAMSSSTTNWVTSNYGLNARYMRGLALFPGDENSLFAGYWMETPFETTPLFETRDRGVNWTSMLGSGAKFIRTVVIDPTSAAQPTSMTVYAGGLSHYISGAPTRVSLYRSDDGGSNWLPLEQGLPPGQLPGSVQRLAIRQITIDPRSCTVPPARGRCRSGPLQRVFALSSTEGWRVIRSDLRGDQWISADAADGGLPIHTDDGNVYESIAPVDLEVTADGEVFLSTLHQADAEDGSPVQPVMASGVFRSTDGGLHWQQRSNGLPLLPGATQTYPDVTAIASHPRRAGVLWAAVADDAEPSRLYKTLDGGATWFATSPVLSGCRILDLQVDTSAPDLVYAAGSGVGFSSACVYRSEDGGATWHRIGGNSPFRAISDVRWNENAQQRLVVTTDLGVWELSDAPDKIFIDRFDD